MKKHLFLWWTLMVTLTWALFATGVSDTIRYTLSGTHFATWPYDNQITAWGWSEVVRLMRSGSEDWVWDYLRGTYYDPAHGRFTFPASWVNRVQITDTDYTGTLSCPAWLNGKMLAWTAQSELFGPVDFSNVHICIPTDLWLWHTAPATLGWYIESPFIWRKNVNLVLDSSDDAISETDTRRIKIIGLSTSQNFQAYDEAQLSEVRVFGNITKPELRTLMTRNVASITRNLTSTVPSSGTISDLSWDAWQVSTWTRLRNNTVQYFRSTATTGEVPKVNIRWDNLAWNKTLVVEWVDVYINWDITWDGILGIIALQRNGRGWNIYIDRNVTDIHAMIYADRSVMSARTHNWNFEILSGDWNESLLLNQLYIKWVLFSENTIWGAHNTENLSCPFYVREDCDLAAAAKYDLNYLRRYQMLEEVDDEWNITIWPRGEQSAGIFDSSNDVRDNLDQYPVILEYDNRIINDAPPLFSR